MVVPKRHRTRSARKSIYDPVHGLISLDAPMLELIAHPAFQRLWGIRQTGFAHLVFPGANHTRLEHSLGVAWVAREMALRLALSPAAVTTVAVAGLLHDLGHAPFSHTLDGPMREMEGRDHESVARSLILGLEAVPPSTAPARASIDSLPEILERHEIKPQDVGQLVDQTLGRSTGSVGSAILHGPVDADRIDYLQRDAHYTGVAHGAVDAVRLLDTVSARTGRLVFAEKGRSAVEGFLVGRSLMYSSVYYHKTVRSAEVMAQAAVERLPGYPESARPLLRQRDGDVLATLERAEGISRDLGTGLLDRRLYKRARAWRVLSERDRKGWLRLDHDPSARRQLEDEVAHRLHAPAGSVLFDLAGLDTRTQPGDDWSQVGVLEGRTLSYPFGRSSVWSSFTNRPRSNWSVTAYVHPRYRASATRWLDRDASILP
ncbi:MAG: HD domain-containing protein [Thermoplasmata archaeon]